MLAQIKLPDVLLQKARVNFSSLKNMKFILKEKALKLSEL